MIIEVSNRRDALPQRAAASQGINSKPQSGCVLQPRVAVRGYPGKAMALRLGNRNAVAASSTVIVKTEAKAATHVGFILCFAQGSNLVDING
jgi:hypothetical protein